MSTQCILVIDDDVDFTEITKTILETKPYRVVIANSQDEGWEKLEEEIPDLIILDVMMQEGADGFKFARQARKDERYANIPIIMLTSMTEQTGFAIPGEKIHPKFLPVDEYVEKPIEPDVLLEKVARHLARKSDDPTAE